ncbi:hypothetical protein OIY81_1670 [Cryptosporidium canis]|nr:hypothetical protein OIY81_1670 [Cryptosporidium canis]
MKKDIVTFGGVESICLRLGSELWDRLRDVGMGRVNMELRMIFNSENDKVFKLILDYIHLMNRRVCSGSCILCQKIMQECETRCGKRRMTILLSRSDDLDVLSDSELMYNIEWNIRGKEKHYELVGLLSQSIISQFIFPQSILQYSNSRMFLILKSSIGDEILWTSSLFLLCNFVRFRGIDQLDSHTQILLKSINSTRPIFILSETRTRIIQKSQLNMESISKFPVGQMISSSIRLHKILTRYRLILEHYNKVNGRYLNSKISLELVVDSLKSRKERLNNVNLNMEIFESKLIEKKIQHERIQQKIKELKESHLQFNSLINECKMENDDNIMQIQELMNEINMYRNDIINKVSYCIYPISIDMITSNFKIRNVLLPLIHVIQNLNSRSDEQISTSLGFSLHYLEIISKILEIPTPNKIL